VVAHRAEALHAGVAVAGEIDAAGEQGAVELEDGAKLEFEVELGGVGRKCAAFEEPTATGCHGGEKDGNDLLLVLKGSAAQFDHGKLAGKRGGEVRRCRVHDASLAGRDIGGWGADVSGVAGCDGGRR
jgi:hypothetical protein